MTHSLRSQKIRPPQSCGRLGISTLIVMVGVCAITASCGRDKRHTPAPPFALPKPTNAAPAHATTNLLPKFDLPHTQQRLGTAVVILVDTSGSMEQTVNDHSGHPRTKDQIARQALQKIIEITDAWQSSHQETPLFLGITSFSSKTSEVLKMEPFDASKSKQAVQMIP